MNRGENTSNKEKHSFYLQWIHAWPIECVQYQWNDREWDVKRIGPLRLDLVYRRHLISSQLTVYIINRCIGLNRRSEKEVELTERKVV